MSRFAQGDRVITPKHGPGVVETVFSRGLYAVAVDGQKNALVLEERELRAEPANPDGKIVRCADCAQKAPSTYAASTVRCTVFRQLRSKNAPRACRSFAPSTQEVTP